MHGAREGAEAGPADGGDLPGRRQGQDHHLRGDQEEGRRDGQIHEELRVRRYLLTVYSAVQRFRKNTRLA